MTIDQGTWWRDAVVYQIYPRSFADANGDGVGDLVGARSRVPYLAALGVDAVWLSPFYPSALADGGYDVDDYRAVDPRIGTLDQFDALVAALHAAGIRLFVDIVPNHSSNRHAAFQAALSAGPGSPERDRYLFRPGLGPDRALPPTDWTANFGGPAWEPVGDGEFYFHLFAPEQPDWNWANPLVREDFLTTLRFWADHGVDGFRIDVAAALAKDFSADPLPSAAELAAIPFGPTHPFYDRDEIDEIYAGWRAAFDEYDPPRVAVAELWAEPSPRKARYAKILGQAFFFDFLHAGFDARRVRRVVDDVLSWTAASGSAPTWVLSNHDVVRHATRFGLPDVDSDDIWAGDRRDRRWLAARGAEPAEDVEAGLRRARALTLFMLALPGSSYLYQGEELGLREVADLPDNARQDPIFARSGGRDIGRDGCRVPLPWTPGGPSFGFGPGGAHLPQPAWFKTYAVAVQESDPASTLNLYRRALAARRDLLARPGVSNDLTWLPTDDHVLAFARGPWTCLLNTGTTPVPLPEGEIIVASGDLDDDQSSVPGETAVWLLT
ncbi:MAG: glycoside hydrolase family 13 protein [Actinomycetia bacterium]|nr:glycoside hydrolase family 13 protein [Actinomycetes bacterium]